MPRDDLQAVGLTDVGCVRQFNEDRIVVAPASGVAAVADGMGGHRAGEVAAQIAVDVVLRQLQRRTAVAARSADDASAPRLAVRESINQANSAIHAASRADVTRHGMGTTLALAWFAGDRAILAHVGDSRIYRFRGGALELLTRDDSLLHDEIDAGLIAAEQAADSHNRSLVTRALGVAADVEPHLADVDARPGDVFVLCTDGLSDLVDDDDIALVVGALQSNLPLAARHLVDAAKDNGGYDNVSVVLVKVVGSAGTGWLARVAGWLRRRGR